MKKIKLDTFLTNAIASTIEAGSSHQGNLRTEAIPISQLVLDPQNARDLAIGFEDLPDGPKSSDPQHARKLKELEELKSFAEEIKEDGIIQPIVVYNEGNKFHVISGERRSLSSAIAGKNYIPAIIRSKPNDEYKLTRIQWNENLQRKNLNLWERLQGIDRLLKSYIANVDPNVQASPSLIAKITNFSMSMAVDYFSVLNADEKLMNAIKEQKIDNVKKAVHISKITDKEAKQKAIDACIAGATLEDLSKLNVIIVKPTIKPAKVAGRQATQVVLGKTKNLKIAKTFFDLIVKEPKFQDVANKLDPIDWTNYGQVSKLFSRMISLIEKRIEK